MRKSTLAIAVLSSASLLLRRSRRFGPIKGFLLGALLEEVVRQLRAQEELKGTAPKPSIWHRLTKSSKPSSSEMRAPQ